MDLKNKIINDHLNFRRISQEGGYYVNSSINQTILHDLPKFYDNISNKIDSSIKQLNNSGKKVSEKSQDNITDFLNGLRRKEQQLETLSLSLNSIYLDKTFTNQIITMDDILKYSDNLKSYQLKGYDIIDSLGKIINSSKVSKPLSVETNSEVNMSSSIGISPSQVQIPVSSQVTASLQINNSLSTPTSNAQSLTSSGPTTTANGLSTGQVQTLVSSQITSPLQTQVSSSSTTTETAQEANAQAEEAQKEAQAQAQAQALARKQEDEKVKKARFLEAQAQEQALARLQEAKLKDAKAKEAKAKKAEAQAQALAEAQKQEAQARKQAEEKRKKEQAEEARKQEALLKYALIKFDKIKELHNIDQLSKVLSSRKQLLQLASEFNSKTNVNNKEIDLINLAKIIEN